MCSVCKCQSSATLLFTLLFIVTPLDTIIVLNQLSDFSCIDLCFLVRFFVVWEVTFCLWYLRFLCRRGIEVQISSTPSRESLKKEGKIDYFNTFS